MIACARGPFSVDGRSPPIRTARARVTAFILHWDQCRHRLANRDLLILELKRGRDSIRDPIASLCGVEGNERVVHVNGNLAKSALQCCFTF